MKKKQLSATETDPESAYITALIDRAAEEERRHTPLPMNADDKIVYRAAFIERAALRAAATILINHRRFKIDEEAYTQLTTTEAIDGFLATHPGWEPFDQWDQYHQNSAFETGKYSGRALERELEHKIAEIEQKKIAVEAVAKTLQTMTPEQLQRAIYDGDIMLKITDFIRPKGV